MSPQTKLIFKKNKTLKGEWVKIEFCLFWIKGATLNLNVERMVLNN